jgi:transposase
MKPQKGTTENKAELSRLRQLYQDAKKRGDVKGALRAKALKAYYKGIPLETVASSYDVSPRTFKEWVKQFEREEGVEDQPRSGRPKKLPKDKEEELKQIIVTQSQRVWTARHVYVVLATTFQVVYAVKYIPELLRGLGLSFHKASHELARRNNEARRKWIQETLPALYADKIKEGWRIFYQDEVGFQTEGTLAYTWGLRGKETVVKNYGRHGRVNLMGAFELGTGVFYGVLTRFYVNACRFRRFLCHLKRAMRTDKLLLICDNARFHHAKWLKEWVEHQTSWLRLVFLPAYSPDFNPIERLWSWIKDEYTHNQCWQSQTRLLHDLAKMVSELSDRASEIKSVMRQELERLKQVFEYYQIPSPAALEA